MVQEKLAGTGIILAGGAATRMGLNKALLPWREGTLLSHVAAIVATIMGKTMIVGFRGQLRPIPGTDVEMIEETERLGPLGGIRLGLSSMGSTKALIVACDTPFINKEAIERLWSESEEFDVTLPSSPEGLHPLFGVYARSCLPHIEASLQKGERKVLAFFGQVRVKDMATENNSRLWERVLININSPAEYARARELDGQAPGSGFPD